MLRRVDVSGKRVFEADGTRFRGRGISFFAFPLFFTLLAAVFFLFAAFGAAVLAAAGILGLGASVLGRLFRTGGRKTPKPETAPGDAIALGEENYEIRDVRSGPSGGG